MTNPAGGVTRYEYAGDSRVPATVIDPAGAVTRSTVLDGLVTETVDPSGAKTTFGYDAARRLTSTTDPAGQHWTAAELVEWMGKLRALIRTHAGAVVWAGVQAEVGTRRVLSARYQQPAFADGAPRPPRPEVDHLADFLVPDAMWCQILSAGHVGRVGGLPAGAAPLAEGRAELTVGKPEQWVPGHPDGDAVRARGRELLARCLISEQEALEMTVARARPGRRSTYGSEG